MIIETALTLEPVEIKSGQTISQESLQGLLKWQTLAGEKAGQLRLIYGGQDTYTRKNIKIVPWQKISALQTALN